MMKKLKEAVKPLVESELLMASKDYGIDFIQRMKHMRLFWKNTKKQKKNSTIWNIRYRTFGNV